ncbi:MAG: carboxypeptidase-like regulatory domain-containing protein [Pirellula sp.]|nr:carboxypeptidase-like regulatory domain-containing protein [Pirellula sp.]
MVVLETLDKYFGLMLGIAYICIPLLVLVGCSSGESRLPTYAAKGQLLAADGQPVPHALVVLHSIDGDATAPKPRATTDLEGKFQLTTYDTADGAPEGSFVVTVEQWLRVDPNEPPKNLLPQALSSKDSSDIRVAISKSENVLEPIRLR